MTTPSQAESLRTEIHPIFVHNIKPEIAKNAIKLSNIIKKGKPNVTISEIKIVKNNSILVYPFDEKSANSLLKPWPADSELGKAISKLPQNKNKMSVGAVICGINPEIKDQEIKVALEDQAYEPTEIGQKAHFKCH